MTAELPDNKLQALELIQKYYILDVALEGTPNQQKVSYGFQTESFCYSSTETEL